MNGIGKFKSVSLDTNIFIYHFEENPEFTPYTAQIFEKIAQGEFRATTSVVSLIETLSYPSPPVVIRGITETFLNFPNLEIINVNQQIALEAAKIRRKYGFRMPDSIQLATALFAKSNAFVTNDARLKGFKRLPIILLKSI